MTATRLPFRTYLYFLAQSINLTTAVMSVTMAALVGGGLRAKPGEASLAHHGILFLDELPEFAPPVLDALRQPLETGECIIARANHRVSYPSDFQLVAAMNPCRCGMAGEPGHVCARGLRCQTDRSQWLGRNHSTDQPLARMNAVPTTSTALETGLDPVAALGVKLRLAPGAHLALGVRLPRAGAFQTMEFPP